MDRSWRRILVNAGYRLATGGLEIARGLIAIPIAARTLGPDEFGILGVGTATAMLLAATVAGFDTIVIRGCARDPASESATLATARRLRLAMAGIAFAVAVAVGALLFGPVGATVCALVSLGLCFDGLATRRLALTARLHDARLTLARLLSAVLFVAAVAVAAALSADVVVFAAIYATQAGLLWLLADRFARPLVPSLDGVVPARALLRAAAPAMVFSTVRGVSREADVLVLSLLGGAPAAGVLAATKRFIRPAVLVGSALESTLVPAWANVRSSEILGFARRFLTWALAPAIAVGLLYATVIPRFVTALLGPGFEPAGALLPIFAIATALTCIQVPLSACLVVTNHQSAVARIEVISLVVTQVVLWTLFPVVGLVAAAWAAVAGTALATALTLRALVAVAEPSLAPANEGSPQPLPVTTGSDVVRAPP